MTTHHRLASNRVSKAALETATQAVQRLSKQSWCLNDAMEGLSTDFHSSYSYLGTTRAAFAVD